MLPPWVLATFVLEVLALAAIAILSYRGFQDRLAVTDLTTNTLETLQRLESVLVSIMDAETGERGYVLTGDARYLQPYENARSSLRTQLADLQGSLSAGPAEAKRADLLGQLVDRRLAELRQTVSLQRTGHAAAALAAVRSERGEELTDSIRRLVSEMENSQQATLQATLDRGRASTRSLSLLVETGPALLFLLIAVSAWTTARFFRQREVEAWVRAGAAQLSSRLHGELGLDQLGDRVVRFLAAYLDACVGAVQAVAPDGRLVQCGAYALAAEDRVAGSVPIGAEHGSVDTIAGLPVQAVREQRALHVENVPEHYLRVNSSLGSARCRELLVVPALADGTPAAVVELGFFRSVGNAEKRLLERATESVGAAFRAEQYRRRQAELLEETRRQAQELQAQQAELEATNHGLEEQTCRLRESQEELQNQQAALEETNSHLEEQARLLESQKQALLTTQELLQHKAAQLERATRYKSEFLANMSHELRTPLNSSLILAKLLMDNKERTLTPEQVRYAQSIYSAGNDLLALINDILDLAKVESGKIDLEIQPTKIACLVEGLRSRFEPLANERDIALGTTIEPDCPETLETDGERLRQVLTNLLSNALKFTERGEVRLHVARHGPSHLAFTVEDTGIGIAPEQQEVIFEAFRQADGTTNRRYGGTGLGLSISRELVALLGGEITLRSSRGLGSAFTVLLPRRPAAEAEPPADRRPPRQLAAAIDAEPPAAAPFVEDDRDSIADPRRVLLVIEDDPAFAEILRDLGREHGYQCVVARGAAEGLKFARTYSPAAVLLDIGLPDHSGLTVLELLKRDPAARHVPVHIVSVHDYGKVARELGAVGFALKPVDLEQLAGAFRTFEEHLLRDVKRVLVVEDEGTQREAIARLLQADGVEIVAVATADEAIAELCRRTFDCCVVDLMLPVVSGFELLERMAGHEPCSFPPVIVYTGRMLSLDEQQRLRRLSSSIIVKGARSPERLLEEVTLFLHKVEAELPEAHRRMLEAARDREAVFDGRRVLLVEDDVRSIFALTRVLEPKGLRIDVAQNGREAIERLEEEPVDLVLMDLMMPEMDGFAATREIRKDSRWASLPIIALTSKAMPDDRAACLEAGANEFIAKPVEVEKLLSLLRVWLR